MDKRQVYQVDSVALTRIGSKPQQVNITAYGSTSTPGWTRPQLVAFVYVQAPPDGIYDFDLVAVASGDGPAAQVLTPLPEPASLTQFTPDGFRGVRIHAVRNKIEGLLAEDSDSSALGDKGTIVELVKHLATVADAFTKADAKAQAKGRDCREACHQAYIREVQKCRDLTCVTKATGRYVLCLRGCEK